MVFKLRIELLENSSSSLGDELIKKAIINYHKTSMETFLMMVEGYDEL